MLLYGFGPQADFEGRLVGALERLESGGALRILDVLFVRRDAESGDLDAIDLHGDGAGGVVAPLLSFRLDEASAVGPPSARCGPTPTSCATSARCSSRARRWLPCSSTTSGATCSTTRRHGVAAGCSPATWSPPAL